MSKRGRDAPAPGSDPAPAAAAAISLHAATPRWLRSAADASYLALEDGETGDVLLPLFYLKGVLGVNYSRKLASLRHREVTVPRDAPGSLGDKGGLLYWRWAFEAPLPIKALLRRELGEELTPQGHLRLVLLPIVYNALVLREELHDHPLLAALHAALRPSAYWPLLTPPPEPLLAELDGQGGAAADGEGKAVGKVFDGPRSLEASALKYMFLFKDQEEVEASKKLRTTGSAAQQEGVSIMEEMVRGSNRPAAAAPADKAEAAAERGVEPAPAAAAAEAGTGAPSRPEGEAAECAAAPVGPRVPPPGGSPAAGRGAPPPLLPAAVSLGLSQSARPDAGGRRTVSPTHAASAGLGGPLGEPLGEQLRWALQAELAPVKRQLSDLAQEMAALRRSLGEVHSLLQAPPRREPRLEQPPRPPTAAAAAASPADELQQLLQGHLAAMSAAPRQQQQQQPAPPQGSLAREPSLSQPLPGPFSGAPLAPGGGAGLPPPAGSVFSFDVAALPSLVRQLSAQPLPAGGLEHRGSASLTATGSGGMSRSVEVARVQPTSQFGTLGSLLSPAAAHQAPPLTVSTVLSPGPRPASARRTNLGVGSFAAAAGGGGGGGLSADLAGLLLGSLSSSLSSLPSILGGSSRDSSAWSSLLRELEPGTLDAAVAALSQFGSLERPGGAGGGAEGGGGGGGAAGGGGGRQAAGTGPMHMPPG